MVSNSTYAVIKVGGYLKRMLDIDCGCGFSNSGGQLGCIRLEDMTEYYSNDGVFTKEEAAAWPKTLADKCLAIDS